jgi:hypothetical protein
MRIFIKPMPSNQPVAGSGDHVGDHAKLVDAINELRAGVPSTASEVNAVPSSVLNSSGRILDAYLASSFVKTVNSLSPDANGNINVTVSGGYDGVDAVKITGDQTIGGIKTFSNPPLSPVAATSGNQLVRKTELDLKANASATVNVSGDQTITGNKTFSSAPFSSVAAVSGNQLVRKNELDLKADSSTVSAKADATATVNLTGTQTIAGAKTFSLAPASSVAAASTNELVRKGELDAAIAGISGSGGSGTSTAPYNPSFMPGIYGWWKPTGSAANGAVMPSYPSGLSTIADLAGSVTTKAVYRADAFGTGRAGAEFTPDADGLGGAVYTDSTPLNGAANGTVAGQFMIPISGTLPTGDMTIFARELAYKIVIDSTLKIRLLVGTDGVNWAINSTYATALTRGTNYYFVLSFNSGNVTLRLNGTNILSGTITSSLATNTNKFTIGGINDSGGYPLRGYVGSMIVGTQTLSSSDIANLESFLSWTPVTVTTGIKTINGQLPDANGNITITATSTQSQTAALISDDGVGTNGNLAGRVTSITGAESTGTWTVPTGTATITSNQFSLINDTVAVIPVSATPNYSVAAQFLGTGDLNVIARYQSAGNFYQAGRNSLYKCVAGSYTSLVAAYKNGAAPYGAVVSLAVAGNTLQVFVDGVAATDVIVDNTFSLAGSAGIRTGSSTAAFDNFRIARRALPAVNSVNSIFPDINGNVVTNGLQVINFGTTTTTARPAGVPNGGIYWVGSGTVLPANALPADLVYLP